MREQDNWRYTSVTPTWFGLDSRVLAPFILCLFHTRQWTLYLAIATSILFFILTRFRITPVEAMRGAWLWANTLAFRPGWREIRHRQPRQDT